MKSIVLCCFLLLAFSIGQAEGWNSVVTTSFNASSYNSLNVHANRQGVHVLLKGTSNGITHVLLSSSGSVIRQTTWDGSYSCDYPNVAGDNSTVYVAYLRGSAIKVKKSTDAGSTWTALGDITFSDAYCSGVDAVFDSWGLHVAYATRPSTSGPWETYYRRREGDNWVGNKNVTDYDANEVGGFPSVTVSATRVHVSYNTSDGTDQDLHPADQKTRDYNFNTQQWEIPQLVTVSQDFSVQEKIQSDGSYLHSLFVETYGGGPVIPEIYHTKRTVGGTSWSTPVLVAGTNADRPRPGVTVNGVLHVLYRGNSLLKYRYYNGSSWSSEQTIINDTPIHHDLSAVSNDLYVAFKSQGSSYLRYRQYDAVPRPPQGIAISGSVGQHPTISWTASPETDLSGYKLYRKVTPDESQFYLIATLNSSTTSYSDPDVTIRSGGTGGQWAQYYVKAYDVANNLSDPSSTVSKAVDYNPPKISPGQEVTEEIPREFSLAQNFPNPFNPSTTIRFGMPVQSHVSLRVYTALGEEVKLLVEGEMAEGYHEVEFDASSLAGGVYFYRLQAGDFVQTKRLLLLK